METIRTFVALELPDAVDGALAEARAHLAFLDRQVRWVRPERVHLTLTFLGDVSAESVPEVVAAVQTAAKGMPVLNLQTSGPGGFPNSGRARVVWLGVNGDLKALQELHRRVNRGLEGLGFAPEKRKFFPHLTFGRARRKPVRVPGKDLAPVRFRVDRVTVMRSELGPGGAVYSPLGYGILDG